RVLAGVLEVVPREMAADPQGLVGVAALQEQGGVERLPAQQLPRDGQDLVAVLLRQGRGVGDQLGAQRGDGQRPLHTLLGAGGRAQGGEEVLVVLVQERRREIGTASCRGRG